MIDSHVHERLHFRVVAIYATVQPPLPFLHEIAVPISQSCQLMQGVDFSWMLSLNLSKPWVVCYCAVCPTGHVIMCLSVLQDIVAQADETPTTLYVSEQMTSDVYQFVSPYHHPLFFPFSLFPSSLNLNVLLSFLSSSLASFPSPFPLPSSPFPP